MALTSSMMCFSLKQKIGHEKHRCLYGIEKFLRTGGTEYPIKIGGKAVPLCANNMASPATGSLDKFAAPLHHLAVFHGKVRVFGWNQVMMGDRHPVRPGVAPVA